MLARRCSVFSTRGHWPVAALPLLYCWSARVRVAGPSLVLSLVRHCSVASLSDRPSLLCRLSFTGPSLVCCSFIARPPVALPLLCLLGRCFPVTRMSPVCPLEPWSLVRGSSVAGPSVRPSACSSLACLLLVSLFESWSLVPSLLCLLIRC